MIYNMKLYTEQDLKDCWQASIDCFVGRTHYAEGLRDAYQMDEFIGSLTPSEPKIKVIEAKREGDNVYLTDKYNHTEYIDYNDGDSYTVYLEIVTEEV